MSTVLEQIPIRLAFSPVSDPPNAPIDSNTGLAAAWWRGGSVALECGIFDSGGSCVDLTNATAVQLIIQETPTSPDVLLNKSVAAASIIPNISVANWLSGDAQQFSFSLLNGETDFDLGGQDSALFWLSLRVYTSPSTFLIYGAGYVTVYNPGVSIPMANPVFVSLHAQTNNSGNSTISPTAVVHTEQVTITGAATVRNLLVSTVGLPSGARIDVAVVFGVVTNGVTINLYNTTTSGTLLFTFIRAGDEPNALFRLVANGAGGFLDVEQVIPAFPVL
jgi:hypothetical protein